MSRWSYSPRYEATLRDYVAQGKAAVHVDAAGPNSDVTTFQLMDYSSSERRLLEYYVLEHYALGDTNMAQPNKPKMNATALDLMRKHLDHVDYKMREKDGELHKLNNEIASVVKARETLALEKSMLVQTLTQFSDDTQATDDKMQQSAPPVQSFTYVAPERSQAATAGPKSSYPKYPMPMTVAPATPSWRD